MKWNNYTSGFGPEGEFAEGQEVRVSLTADLAHEQKFAFFNTTEAWGDLNLKVFIYDSTIGGICTDYISSTTAVLHYETKEYGLSLSDKERFVRYVSTAFVTFTAPLETKEFIICVRHSPFVDSGDTNTFRFDFSAKWVMFTKRGIFYDTNPTGFLKTRDFIFRAKPAEVFYFLNSAVAGQYAVIELNSISNELNFTRPSGNCSYLAPENCRQGDSLKIVPSGMPCTYEAVSFRHDPFYGSAFTEYDGSWDATGVQGVFTGATSGGVGLFGMQDANPLVETTALYDSGDYGPEEISDYQAQTISRRTAYVYVRLPKEVGSFDFCFSQQQRRAVLRGLNSTSENIPMWAKLFPCSSERCVQRNTQVSSTSFEVLSHSFGWTMSDIRPGTYGTIRIDTGTTTGLMNLQAVHSVEESPAYRNYFNSIGGDQIRIVSVERFSETYTQRNEPNENRPFGSTPDVGCWFRDNDRAWDEGTDMPSSITNLQGDPTLARSTTIDDPTTSTEGFGGIFIPNAGEWMVCYRRGGLHGWITLPFHTTTHGVPTKWSFLESAYTPASTFTELPSWAPTYLHHSTVLRTSTPLVAGFYGTPEQKGTYPPDVVYYSNDTRAGTWGPLSVFNRSEITGRYSEGVTGVLSALQWDYKRTYVTTSETVMATKGTAVRLVHPSRSCDDPTFSGSEDLDGGGRECNNAHAGVDCAGSSMDSSGVSTVTYYLTYPECASTTEPAGSTTHPGCTSPYCNLCNSLRTSCLCLYKVCWRQGGFNWQVISPQDSPPERSFDASWEDVSNAVYIPGSVLNLRTWRLRKDLPGFMSGAVTGEGGYYGSNIATKYIKIDRPPTLSLFHLETRGGMEAGFIITDPEKGLSTAPRGLCIGSDRTCDNSGDVFRIVEASEPCDITPTKWGAGQAAYADTHLSLYCPVQGQGSITTSGLVTYPCNTDNALKAEVCDGTVCSTSSAQLPYLLAARSAPDPVHHGAWHIYDDVVPGDSVYWGAEHTFASLVLPPYSAVTQYKHCYKQAVSPNWVIFNSSWTLEAPPTLTIYPTETDRVLLGGELQEFTLSSVEVFFVGIAAFEAKFVLSQGENNDGCANLPGGTEATPFSRSNSFEANASISVFHVIVPEREGKYWLCVRFERDSQDSLSWNRFGRYSVRDNQVRWFLTAGNLPMNQGASLVSLARCKWLPIAGYCDPTAATETFTTDPHVDMAKVVPWTHACHGGRDGQTDHGNSIHVGREGGGVNGVQDLGPADGLATTADFVVTLPATTSDVATTYKLCVNTYFGAVHRRAWAEVREAVAVSSQVFREDSSGKKLHFTTTASTVFQWSASSQIQSFSNLTLSGVVVLAGASTKAVGGMAAGVPYVHSALNVSVYSGASIATDAVVSFKLVQKTAFATRLPPPPYTGEGWKTSATGASCMSTSVTGSVTGSASGCSDPDLYDAVSCPRTSYDSASNTVMVDMQLPVEPGYYLLCYRAEPASGTSPWVNLLDSNGNDGIWLVPPFIEFDAGQISAVSPEVDTLSLSDTRTAGGVALSSWCSLTSGVNCTAENGGLEFNNDWVAIMNDTMNCPVVSNPTTMTWEGGKFYQIKVSSNETALASGGMRIPPALTSPTNRYKICLLKAGDWGVMNTSTDGRRDLIRRGVSYQLWNRASPTYETLGLTGFFQPAQSNVIDELRIDTTFSFNSSTQFLIVDGQSTLDAYQSIPKVYLDESSPSLPSATPVIRSGQFIDLTVSALSGGNLATYSSMAFEVRHCTPATTWDDLLCKTTTVTAPFDFVNTVSSCKKGAEFGWPSGGLKQFLRGGTSPLRLQYRSQCPLGTYTMNVGCGIKIIAVTDSGQEIASKPLWLNVLRNQPDSVAIDYDIHGAPQTLTTDLLPAAPKTTTCQGPPICFVKTCRTHRACSADVMALFSGPREFSTLGSFQVRYSSYDYGGVDSALLELQQYFSSGVRQFLDNEWTREGTFRVTFTPKLKAGVQEGFIFYNITYGAALGQKSWTRVVLRIVRPQAERLLMQEIVPLDTGASGISQTLQRQPAPVWRATEVPTLDFTKNSESLIAQAGGYLEALVPYEARFKVEGLFDGKSVLLEGGSGRQDLDGWLIQVEVKNVVGNRIMQVVYDPPCVYPSCTASAGSVVHTTANMLTSAAYSTQLPVVEPIAVEVLFPSRKEDVALWVVRFRIQSGLGCGRISGTAQGGVGCALSFVLKPASQLNTAPAVSAEISTPVRTVANTVQVTVDRTTSPLHEGITVTMVPGIIDGRVEGSEFLVDEFHYGSMFALVASPLPMSFGIYNRDGVRADYGTTDAPLMFQPSIVIAPSGQTWGVTFNMKPTKPCIECEFTFHSTWGAGPTSAVTKEGSKVLSFTDTANGVYCTPDLIPQVVGFATGSSTTSSFNINVTAGVLDTSLNTPVIWPRWRVYIHAQDGITIPASDGGFASSAGSKVRLWKDAQNALIYSATMGVGGVATFSTLQFELIDTAAGASFPSQVDLEFTTTRIKYSNTKIGSIKESVVSYSCKSRTSLERIDTVSSKSIQMDGTAVTGAVPLCTDGPIGCTHWEGTLDDTLSFPIAVYRKINGQNLLYEGHGGTPSVRISSRAASWTCTTTTCQTNTLTLKASVHSDIIYIGGQVFTYGASGVELSKTAKQPASGNMFVTMKKFTSPVRGVPVDLCLTKTTDGNEVIDSSVECVTIHLYLKPTRIDKHRIGVASSDLLANQLKAGSDICGPGTLGTVGLIVYYVYGGKNYVAYDVSVTYTVRTKVGLMFSQPNSAISVEQLTSTTALPAGASKLERYSHSFDPVSWVKFYGLKPILTPFNLIFEGTDNDNVVSLSAIQSTLQYTYEWPVKLHTAFDVLDFPLYGDECVQKTHLPTTVANYRAFTTNPGKGWGYAHHGAVVGVPFPIQARASHNSKRSYGYEPTLVMVTKLSATACNDGGTLTNYILNPTQDSDGVVLLDGTLQNSFQPLAVGKTTEYGQATIWPAFSKPCEACTLEVSLCYKEASFSSDSAACLKGATSAESEPVFGERMKSTKTFTVHYPEETNLHVIEQSEVIPTKVGELFTLQYAVVQEHAGWTSVVPADHRGTARVWAYTKFTGDVSSTSTTMKYGNGGFLHAASAGGQCFVGAPEFSGATENMWGARGKDGTLGVYFTRPCHSCEMWVRYEVITKHSNRHITGEFPLRRYSTLPSHKFLLDSVPRPHEILKFSVTTCGTGWTLSGTPLAAVRRKTHFSISIMRSDQNLVPTFEDAALPAQLLEASPRKVMKANGGGGHLVNTGPLSAQTPPTVTSYQGFATMRMMYSRACYECGFSFGGQSQTLAVLTEATQAIVNPINPAQMQQNMNGTARVEFLFEVYAADEMGDRSYATGGPSYLQWNARYQQQTVSTEQMSLFLPVIKPFAPTDSLGRSVSLLPSASTVGTLRIEEGVSVQDGIPQGVSPGIVKLTLQEPVTDFPIAFKIGGAVTGLPTRVGGSREAPKITYTVPADRFFVKNYDVLQTQLVVVGDVLSVVVATAGPLPGAPPEELVYYLAKHAPGVVFSAQVNCAAAPSPQCTGCEVTVDGELNLNVSQTESRGEATFLVSIQKAVIPVGETTVNCQVNFASTITPDIIYSLPLSIGMRDPGAWAWVSTENFPVTGAPTLTTVKGDALRAAIKVISLQLFDKDYSAKSSFVHGTPLSSSEIGITTVPPTCFTVTELPYVSLYNNMVTWQGKFSSEGTCEFTGVSGLGPGVVVSQTLSVVVKRTLSARVVGTDMPGNFTGLVTARTKEGNPAAMTGLGIGLQFHILAKDGTVNHGDFTTKFLLEGSTGVDKFSQTTQAVKGLVTLEWTPTKSTRDSTGKHQPWMFNAYSDLQAKPFVIGPLYVVTRATVLQISLQRWGSAQWIPLAVAFRDCSVVGAANCRDGIIPAVGGGKVHYVAGYPLKIKLKLEDKYGNTPTDAEDIGFDPHLIFNPLSVPCRSADLQLYQNGKFFLNQNCQLNGGCVVSKLFPCGVDQWDVGDLLTDHLRIPVTSTATEVGAILGSDTKPMRYVGTKSKLARFMITSSGLDYTLPTEESAWLSQIYFAMPFTLAIGGAVCSAVGTPVVSAQCSLGGLVGMSNVSPSNTTRTIAPLTAFSLSIEVVDEAFSVVSGDDFSVIKLEAVCHDGV